MEYASIEVVEEQSPDEVFVEFWEAPYDVVTITPEPHECRKERNRCIGHHMDRTMLVRAWRAFARGKSRRADVQEFAFNLETNLEELYHELHGQTYVHGPYRMFTRCDPKPRRIAVSSVRDQIVHQLVINALGQTFERSFHPHSYASRPGKGVLVAAETVHGWIAQCSDGGRQRCWALRMDVRSFFASVDHATLMALVRRRVPGSWMWLCERIVRSFGTEHADRRIGLPLGNVTSQLFANTYLHELDRFVAHELHARRYARYMDDWVIIGRDRAGLEHMAERCRVFLAEALRLEAPASKTWIAPVHRGVDWLGFVLFPHHRILRSSTMHRMRSRIRSRVFASLDEGLPYDRLRSIFASYDGLLRHGAHGRERDRLLTLQQCC
ncbi:MAG: reverse transcriptase domain-containing protein [bacterium]|nr:reverse transcriptase domain-containing protein [bacterium]